MNDPHLMAPLAAFHGQKPPAPAWFIQAIAQEPERTFVEVEGAKVETDAAARPAVAARRAGGTGRRPAGVRLRPGRPARLDEDFLIISTVHSAKGLEWPVVHLPHLVDGAVPSDMALSSREGLAEEQRLFYVAVTRAREQLFLHALGSAPHHRLVRDDRHSYGRQSRSSTTGRWRRASRCRPFRPAAASAAHRAAGRAGRRGSGRAVDGLKGAGPPVWHR